MSSPIGSSTAEWGLTVASPLFLIYLTRPRTATYTERLSAYSGGLLLSSAPGGAEHEVQTDVAMQWVAKSGSEHDETQRLVEAHEGSVPTNALPVRVS